MAEKITSYLSEMKFDPKLWNTLQAKYITNFRLVALLILSIVLIGLISFFNIPRRVNPEIKIPIVIVSTVLPGAGPQDVESLVTIPIEDKLIGVKGLDSMTSTSGQGVSVITMQFVSTISPDKAKDDVQSLVDSVTSLPSDAQDPNVQALDFEDQPIWNFAVTTKEDIPSLMRFADILEDKIKESSKIDRVITAGLE